MVNQVPARDVHLSCVACACYASCICQNRVQQCVYTPVIEVLHALNVQAHACVKFKLTVPYVHTNYNLQEVSVTIPVNVYRGA